MTLHRSLSNYFLAKAAIAAANAAAAKTFNAPAPQPLSPQLGRDIDERDRQPPAMMTGDIDERPSDAFNRPTPSVPNLNLFPSSTNLVAPTPAPTLPVSVNEDPMKAKAVQDLFRTTKPTAVETLPTSTSTNTTSAGPSFDFISMLEQLKQQPKQNQSAYVVIDSSFLDRSSVSSPFFLAIIHWRSVVLLHRSPFILYVLFMLPSDLTHCQIHRKQPIHEFQNIKRKWLNGQNVRDSTTIKTQHLL